MRTIKIEVRYTQSKGVRGYECLMPNKENTLYSWAKSDKGIDWESGVYAGEYIRRSSTGLLDKNGREMFEGDRIKTPAGVGIVEWRYGCFRICWNDTDATTLHDTPQDMMEVIGNIYEGTPASPLQDSEEKI